MKQALLRELEYLNREALMLEGEVTVYRLNLFCQSDLSMLNIVNCHDVNLRDYVDLPSIFSSYLRTLCFYYASGQPTILKLNTLHFCVNLINNNGTLSVDRFSARNHPNISGSFKDVHTWLEMHGEERLSDYFFLNNKKNERECLLPQLS